MKGFQYALGSWLCSYFFSSTKRYLSLSICITQGASPHIVATATPTSLSVTMESVYLTASDVITMMTVETIVMKRAVAQVSVSYSS